MLGKRPRPNNFLRKTTSKSQLLSYGNSINKDSPQQVVVGFKLAIEAAEKRRTNPNTDTNSIPNPNTNCNPYQACESPKSVLELCTAPRHSSSCRHSHRAALRSPRSVLGSLLISAGNPVPAGIGLGIVVAIKAEEIAAEEAEAEAAKLMNDESELSRSKLVSLKSDPIPIMVSGLCNSKENCEEESHSFHGEGEDEEEEEEDDDDEMKAEIRSNIHRKINEEEEEGGEAEDFSLNLERKMIKEEEEEEEEEDETEMERIRESIFSTASPAATNNFCGNSSSSHGSFHGSFHGSTHFLSFCCLCKRPLSQGRDIFMYRGDLGFCSAECRYQQIVLDDRKERMLSSSSSSSSSSTTPNCYAMHTHTLPATAAARAAVA